MAGLSVFLNNIFLLLALGVIYDAVSIRNIQREVVRQFIAGILIGIVGIVIMLNSWQFKPGIIFDARWILISISAVFFGRNPTIIAAVILITFRVTQGGEGIYPGIWGIFSSALFGLAFKYFIDKHQLKLTWKSLYLFSIVIELNILTLILLLPRDLMWPAMQAVVVMLLLVFPIASTLLGMLLMQQQRRWTSAEQLSESRRLLSQERGILLGLMNSIPDLICYKGADGKYLGCNDAFAKFIDKDETEIIGQTDSQLFGDEVAMQLVAQDQQAITENCVINDEHWCVAGDGTKCLFTTSKFPFYADGEQHPGIVGVGRDITNQYNDNQLLKKSELTYRSIISTALDGFLIVSEDGVVEDVNQAYLDMSGYSKSNMIGFPLIKLDTIYDQSQLEKLSELTMCGEERRHVSKHQRMDGSIFDVEVNITRWTGDDGDKFFMFIKDITEKKLAQEKLLQSETRFRRVFESMPKIAVQGYNQQREVIFWNKANESIYGYTEEQVLGKKLEDLIIPDQARDAVISEVNEWLRGGEATPASELVLKDSKNNPVTVFSTHVMINGQDDEREMYCIDIDLRAQKEAEDRATTLSQAIEQSPMSVIITNPHGYIEYVNGTFEQTTGYFSHELIDKPISMLRSERTPDVIYRQLAQSLKEGQQWQGEFESVKRNGEVYWEQVHVAPVTGFNKEITHYLAVTHDVTQQKLQEQKIVQQAHFDSLTGLPNRFLALDRLSQMLTDAKRGHYNIAVLFLDFDDFKKVNDTLGHQSGDELLVEAARRLRGVVRESDVIGRLGGDEFIVLVKQESDATRASVIADKLLEQFRVPFVLDGREFVSTISVGISIYPEDGQTPTELLRQADSAMYHSKDGGRDTFHFYTEQMNLDVARRVQIEEQLRLALQHNELHLNYQPFIDLSSKKVIGAEALVRWVNGELGFVGPDEFIPVAEQTGLIVDIGLFVLRTAVKQVAQWRLKYDENFSIAINVSPMQFRDEVLERELTMLIDRYQLPAKAIELEITEGVLISGYAKVESALNEFHQSGISIAMDDFGTGYSSLNYLRKYPFDTLKVDKSFIDDIASQSSSYKLVSATISMGHQLNLSVVAEGIETQEQFEMLVELECDIGQGYFFGKPVKAHEFEQSHFIQTS